MFDLFTALEDAMVLSFYIGYNGDYYVFQFKESAELDAFLATADVFEEDESKMYFLFGSVWIVVYKKVEEDK